MSQKTAGPSAAKKRILIIEDEELLLSLIADELKAAGYLIMTSQTAEDGLLKIKEAGSKIGLIILDLVLPKMDGFEVLKEIKADKELKKIPVIILSNLGEENSIKKAMILGADDYFIKANMTPEKITAMVSKRFQ